MRGVSVQVQAAHRSDATLNPSDHIRALRVHQDLAGDARRQGRQAADHPAGVLLVPRPLRPRRVEDQLASRTVLRSRHPGEHQRSRGGKGHHEVSALREPAHLRVIQELPQQFLRGSFPGQLAANAHLP